MEREKSFAKEMTREKGTFSTGLNTRVREFVPGSPDSMI